MHELCLGPPDLAVYLHLLVCCRGHGYVPYGPLSPHIEQDGVRVAAIFAFFLKSDMLGFTISGGFPSGGSSYVGELATRLPSGNRGPQGDAVRHEKKGVKRCKIYFPGQRQFKIIMNNL